MLANTLCASPLARTTAKPLPTRVHPLIHTPSTGLRHQRRSVSVRFEPRKDEDRVRDPLPHNNDEQLRRRLATEEVICKQEKEDQKAREQQDGSGRDKQDEGPTAKKEEEGASKEGSKQWPPPVDPEVYKNLTFKNAKLDKPKSFDDIARIVLEQQQMAQRRKAEKTNLPAPPEYNPMLPALTRRRESFLGRLAMLGISAACFWELYFPDHPSITAQVSGFTGIPPQLAALFMLTGIAFIVLGGTLWPGSPTYDEKNLRDVLRRPPGPPMIFVNPFKHPKRFLGIEGNGISRQDELFHGRLACIGFLAAIVQEGRLGSGGMWDGSGPGPLAQIAYYLNMPATDEFYQQTTLLLIFGLSAVVTFSFVYGWVTKYSRRDDDFM